MPATIPHCWRCVIGRLRSRQRARTARAARRPRRADRGELNTALPATKVSAPARHTSPIVSRLMPPSTSSAARARAASSMRRARAILSSDDGMNCCPPKPGIHRHHEQEVEVGEHLLDRRERRGRIERDAGGAAELADARELALQVRRRPRRGSSAPSRRRRRSRRSSAPARRPSCARRAAASCTRRSVSMTFAPKVRFGTKRPSITSTWIQSAPPAPASRPRRRASRSRRSGWMGRFASRSWLLHRWRSWLRRRCRPARLADDAELHRRAGDDRSRRRPASGR